MVFDNKILQKTGYNRISLFFNAPHIEAEFKIYHQNQTKSQLRIGLVIGFILISIFSLIEIVHESTDLNSCVFNYMLYSYVTIIPLIVIIFVASYHNSFLKFGEILIALTLLLEGTSTNISHYIIDKGFYIAANYGIIIFLIFSFFMLRIRFLFVSIVCTIISIEYVLVIFLKNYEANYFFAGFLSVSISLLLLLIAGYYTELLIRREYLLIEKINKDNEVKEKLNESLEKEVKRRTVDLVLTNQALKKAMQKAESSDILKSTIIANISHEIRTPLTRIVGFSELLTKGALTEDKKRQYVDIIEENTNQLLNIVTSVMELSKMKSDNFKIQYVTFYLHELLDELKIVFDGISSKMNKTEKLVFVVEKNSHYDEVLVTTDLAKLKKILHGLIHNAVKFTLEGQVRVSYCFDNNGMIEFCVKDEGIGIDEANLEMIFDYFRQEDEGSARRYGGAGVGLSICKGLVMSLGGKIWAHSKKGEGSTFYFSIPLKIV